MSKIEWERQPDGIIAGHADFVRYQAYEGEQETWQRIHDARVASIAAANGYVKLADDEMVVKRLKGGEISFGTANIDDVARHFGYVKLEPGQVVLTQTEARAIYDDNCGECSIGQRKNPPCHGCCMRPIRVALDASGVKP